MGVGVSVDTDRFNQCVAAFQSGDFPQARTMCEAFLVQFPQHAPAWHLLGVITFQQNDLDRAEVALANAVLLQPASTELIRNLAVVKRLQGKFTESRENFERLIALDPEYAPAYFEKALCLKTEGRIDEAIDAYQLSLKYAPADVNTLNNLGNIYYDQKRFEEAEALYLKGITAAPENPMSYNNLGNLYRDWGRYDEAEKFCKLSLEKDSGFCDARYNLGLIYQDTYQLDKAFDAYQVLLKKNPNYHKVYRNLGCLYRYQKQFDKADEAYAKSLALENDYTVAWDRALLTLQQGDYLKGWAQYEVRMDGPNFPGIPSRPRWQGEPLAGKGLLIIAEQGFGDIFQFLRFFGEIKRMGGRVIFRCNAILHDLLSSCPDIDQLLPMADCQLPAGSIDYYCYMMSLPYLLKTTLDTLPPLKSNLLTVSDDVKTQWQERLAFGKACKIGLVWTGNPENKYNRDRSLPFEFVEKLALSYPDITFYSLQKQHGLPTDYQGPIVDLAEQLDSFVDTAAVIEQLDSVITVDTSVAHLAGVLQKPVWVALCYVPDWRWLLDRNDSPWYPTVRLFRQARLNDWQSVYKNLASACQQCLTEKSGSRGVM